MSGPGRVLEVSSHAGLIEHVREESGKLDPDVSTPAGRQAIKSNAYLVTRSKTFIDNMGKDVTERWRKKTAEVNAGRKKFKEAMDELAAERRKPLTDWEAEQAKIEEEKQRKKDERGKNRLAELHKYGTCDVPFEEIREWSDREFGAYLIERRSAWEEEQAKLEAERLAREAEEKRLAEERAEQERIRKEQEAEKKRLEDERKAIEEERHWLELEKQQAEWEKRVEEEIKRAAAEDEKRAQEAAVKAAAEERQRIEREAREREEAEKKAAEEAAFREALRPDKEKIIAYADALVAVPLPETSTVEGGKFVAETALNISMFADSIKENAEAL